MSTGCEFYSERLADLHRGRMSAEGAAEVERHLASCEECRASLEVIGAVLDVDVAIPEGLEARIRGALRGPASGAVAPAAERGGGRRAFGSNAGRPWGLPLAAAAAIALLWLGVGRRPWAAPETGGASAETEVIEEIEPYGSFPAADGVVAGDPLLSELSVEELERLLEEMES